MKNVFTALALAAFATAAMAAIPEGYYDSLEGLSGVTLKKAVKTRAKSHTAIPYGDDTWEVFKESDTRMVGSQLCWWDMYSNNNVAVASGHGGLNIEHSVANSWWGGTKNDAYKDLYHLNPSNSEANNRKSNYPLGIVISQTWGNGVTFVGKPASGASGGAPYVYEPCDEYKGDFARAFFYMFTIYDDISWSNQTDRNFMYDKSSDLTLRPWAYELLLEWAEKDPVSQKEKDRNEAIYKHQKNRNPFIDCPGLAEHIWGKYKNSPYHFDGTIDPGTEPDEPPVDPGKPLPEGYWYAVTSTADLNDKDYYVLVAAESNVTMSHSSGGSYQQVCSALASKDSGSSPARLVSVPSDVAVLHLTKSGAGWLINMTDLQGADKGYLCCTKAKTLNLVADAGTDGTIATITPAATSTSIQFKSGTGTIQYNESAPRFTTYTSSQKSVMLYRMETPQNDDTLGIGTGVAENADEAICGIYTVNGTKVAAESLSGLPRGIYIVVTNHGTRKIAL